MAKLTSFITGAFSLCIMANGFTVTLSAYSPVTNDNLAGVLNVSGTTQSLTGNQQFQSGVDGSINTTLGNVTIISGAQYINQTRLEPGPQNYGITVPDLSTGGNTIFQVYNPANLVEQPQVTSATVVPDIQNVNGNQYINTRIANISNGGTLNVSIGSGTASSTSGTHGWSMAAKQSSLFNIDGTAGAVSTLNWNNNNRIAFFGSAATPASGTQAQANYLVQDVATFKGAFTVQTLDGGTSRFNVTTAAQLKSYNDWLISQLQAGNLDTSRYLTEFNKAFSKANGTIVYRVSATVPDEATQPVGTVVAINASGVGARVNVAAGRTLEVSGATGGAIRATSGAQVTINGKLSSLGDNLLGVTDSSALWLDASSAVNSSTGVINGGFLNNADTSGTGTGRQSSYNADGVHLQNGSTFTNNGVLNFASRGSNLVNGVAAINIASNASAINSGNINVGVNGSSATGTTSGVLLTTPSSSFTNTASGVLYIGRELQNSVTDSVADTAMNQSGLTSGIAIVQAGSAISNGQIVTGTLSQNSAGMSATNATGAVMRNNGVIDVNGRATAIPRENTGMLVLNSGSGDNIANAGVINLNGVNGTGLKVLATSNRLAAAVSSGTINVAGAADPASGTRNYGVWVEGQGSGIAAATIDGPVSLTGNGAIGVHARGNASVLVSDGAIPSFSLGSNQIGFFAYGPNADISVANSRPLTVSTRDSTLFRLEQGADLDTSNMALISAGTGSVGVLGTGDGTDIQTGNGQFTVTGVDASALMIEGGAKGVLDATTTLQLNGARTTGAIVDGQKHTLNGAASGTPLAGTQLTSAAALDSASNQLTGLIARNSAQLINTGDISFSGEGSTGIALSSGATASNSGAIAINNGGTAIQLNGDTLLTTASNSGVLTANGGSVDNRSRGVNATGVHAIANLNGGGLQLNGAGALGTQAANGAQINIAAGSTITFNNRDQIAYYATGNGSQLNSASGALEVNTPGSTAYRLDDGARLNLPASETLTTRGAQSTGIILSGTGTALNIGNSTFMASGSGSNALRVEGGAQATLAAATRLQLDGTDSIGVLVNNLRTDLANALTGDQAATAVSSSASISGNGDHTVGFEVVNGARLTQQGSVTLTGDDSTGIRIRSGGSVANSGTVNVASGTGLDISDAGSAVAQGGVINVADGIAGVRISDGAQLTLNGATINSAGTADGILLASDAAGLSVNDSTMTLTGSGNGLDNQAEISAITLNNATINVSDGSGIRTGVALDPASSANVTVSGSGVGVNITGADERVSSADVTLGSGYQIHVEGAGGVGIRANTSGTLVNAANVSVNDPAGGAALSSATAAAVENSGTLRSQSTVSPVVALSGVATQLENQGVIAAADPALPAVVTGDGNDTVLLTGGAVSGEVNTGAGSDVVQWTAGSLTGGLSLGAGDNNSARVQGVDLSTTSHITSGDGHDNTLTLTQVTTPAGSLADDDAAKGVNLGSGWSTLNLQQSQLTLSDNLQLTDGVVNIDSDSTLYAGDNVQPQIDGDVNNAGIIDLTNGSGSPGNSLTINGNLTSDGGQIRLLTQLNEGGALANQFTDKLLVNGNASTGSTQLDVTVASLSNGNLTDSDHNGQVDADEGISLVQVSGTAQAQSFALSGGYLAAGPWQYQLYSFAPGSSDASQRQVAGGNDNQYWDYRLGNLYVCEQHCPVYAPPPVNSPPGSPTPENPAPGSPVPENPYPVVARVARPAVIPQVPSYLSAPVGLAWYTVAVIDDLHKRLGELRDSQMSARDTGGELFLRYIGSNLRYKPDLSFTDFGYPLDIDYSAMQLGGNLLKWDAATSTLLAGVAWTRGNTRLRPQAADGFSSTTFDSDSVALYSTWLHHSGFYIDGALSFDWHRGTTDISRQRQVGKLQGRGWSASLETGYPLTLAYGIRLEPQAQLMHMQLNMQDFTDREGTRVEYGDDRQTIGRLGIRLDRRWTDSGGRDYTPWLRVSYWQGWGGGAKSRVSAQNNSHLQHTFDEGRFGHTGELGIGGTVNVKHNLALYAEADYRRDIDNNGVQGWRYNIGVRWAF